MRLFLALILLVGLVQAEDKPVKAKPVDGSESKEKPKEPLADDKVIVGTWKLVSMDVGAKIAAPLPAGWGDIEYVFDDKGTATMQGTPRSKAGKYTLDPKAKIKTMEIEFAKDNVMKCLYELDGDTLKICQKQVPNADYPKVFGPDMENKTLVFVLQRNTKKEEKKDK